MSKALWRGCCRFEDFFFKLRRKLLEGKWDFMLCRVSSVLHVVTQNAIMYRTQYALHCQHSLWPANNPNTGAKPGCQMSRSSISVQRGSFSSYGVPSGLPWEAAIWARLKPTAPSEIYEVPKWVASDLKSLPVKEDPHSNQGPRKLDGMIHLPIMWILPVAFAPILPLPAKDWGKSPKKIGVTKEQTKKRSKVCELWDLESMT